MSRELKQISADMLTQDNRITACPIFIVEKKIRQSGFDSSYADLYEWVSYEGDYEVADDEQHDKLEEIEEEFGDTGDWEKCYYVDRWEFVTACFTENGCKAYLAANGHNLPETRIFAASGYRNDEWDAVRKHLMAL